METGCDILLFGTMASIGPDIRCSLEAHGLKVALEDFPQNTFRDEPGYRRKLAKAVSSHNPAVIWPIGNQLAMAKAIREDGSRAKGLRERIVPESIIVPIADADTLALLDSKVRASALASLLGIPQPEIYPGPDAVTEYPMIFKREHGFGGSGVYRPRSAEALEKLIRQEKGAFLLEKFIEGFDVSVDCLRWGAVFKAGCYRCIEKKQGQGPASVREAIDCPEAIIYARKILERLDYRGVCGFDFRMGADGKLYFLEANPRFTGGIRDQIASGFDIPWEYWKVCMS